MYTVNATNFFGFGVDAGDAQIGRVDDGNSQPINFSTPIRFFGTSQSTLYVRISQLNLLAGAVYCDVATGGLLIMIYWIKLFQFTCR